MSKFEWWILKKIAQCVVIQGDHEERIIQYFKVLIKEAKREFYEDNKPTLCDFLLECFDEALKGEYLK